MVTIVHYAADLSEQPGAFMLFRGSFDVDLRVYHRAFACAEVGPVMTGADPSTHYLTGEASAVTCAHCLSLMAQGD